MKGWVITDDLLWEPTDNWPCRVGYGQVSTQDAESDLNSIIHRSITVSTDLTPADIENPVRFRLRDEDDEVHYRGVVSQEWMDNELDYNCQRFGEADTGATIMEHYADDLPEQVVTNHASFGAVSKDGKWVMIYG